MKTALFLRFLKSLAVLTAIMDLHALKGGFVFCLGARGEYFSIRGAGDAALLFARAGAEPVVFCVDASYGLLPLRG